MKFYIIALVGLLIGTGILATPISISSVNSGSQLLGAKECTWGPTYWCSNITNAKSCHAVTHCIQTVWETHSLYPEDNDSICKICLDMVQQARDQLQSNETQDDLKAVFEGSCNLIPIKIVRKECDKLVDDFVPELIEALSSQMDPNTVCSVAGLCNNVAIDRMIAEYHGSAESMEDKYSSNELSCENCNKIGKEIELKFQSKNRDEMLENMLGFCGTMSSYSDACANIIIKYFNEIYNHMKENFIAENICHMSGVCAGNYHKHDEDKIELEIRPMSGVGVVSQTKEDIPCELCEQLVQHLRDLLIANTTEAEFKDVLEGLCNQTQGFKSECLGIVDQYYDVIYQALVQNLDAQGACFMIGICHKGMDMSKTPIMPLVPIETIKLMEKIKNPTPPKKLLGEDEPVLTNSEIQNYQLPIDLIVGPPNANLLAHNGEWCTLCEYFWHFVQETMASPKNEEDIKRVVAETCDKMPKSIATNCHAFVNMYGDAIISLIIQNIDPTQLCPELKLCPSAQPDMEVFSPFPVEINTDNNNKPQCPLCLFAVTEAIEAVRSDKSKKHIQDVLSNLCVHLPSKLRPECQDFIDTYSKELIDMLATDFTPEQICVYFKCCNDSKPDTSMSEVKALLLRENQQEKQRMQMQIEENNEILTNEIPDNTVNGQVVSTANIEYQNTPECSICAQIVKDVETKVVNKQSKEQIKNALEHVCDKYRKFKTKCHKYIVDHEETIINLIMQNYGPKELCRQLRFCVPHIEEEDAPQDLDMDEALLVSIVASPADPIILNSNSPSIYQSQISDGPQCVLCEFIMARLEKELKDKKTDEEIKNAVKSICKKLPKTITNDCQKFVNQYADFVIKLVSTVPPKEICTQMMLCQVQSEILVIPSSSNSIFVNSNGQDAYEAQIGDGPQCILCKVILNAIEKQIANKATDQEIKDAIKNVCYILPQHQKYDCENFIDKYAEWIIKLLATVPPREICSQMMLCEQPKLISEISIISSRPNKKVGDLPQCVLCEFIMNQLEPLIKSNATQDDIKNALDNVCYLAPKGQFNDCKLFINQNYDFIIKFLATTSPKDICSLIMLCNVPKLQSETAIVSLRPNTKVGDYFCVICEFTMKQLETLIKDNATQDQIKGALEYVCYLSPNAQSKKDCEVFINKYYDQIIHLLATTPPKEICSYLMVCHVPKLKSETAIVSSKPNTKDGDYFCVLCEFAMTQLEPLIKNNATQEQIKSALGYVCYLSPDAPSKKDCELFINKYYDQIIHLLATTPPKEICSYLMVCHVPKLQSEIEVLECAVCQGAVQSLDKVLEDPKIDEDIDNVLDRACEELPAKYFKRCTDLVTIYGQSMINLVRQYAEPHKVCTEIGICYPSEYNGFVQIEPVIN